MDPNPTLGEPEPALARLESPPMPTVARWIRRLFFVDMVGTGTVVIVAFFASIDQEHPLLNVGRLPLRQFFYILQGAWASSAFIVLSITVWYCEHPLWDSLHFFTILAMLVYFIQYLKFEMNDLPFFIPIATDMGIVVGVMIKRINDSADRGILRSIWNRAMGYAMGDNGDGRDGRDGNELHNLGPDGRRRNSV